MVAPSESERIAAVRAAVGIRISDACAALETVLQHDPDILRIIADAAQTVIDVDRSGDGPAIDECLCGRVLVGLRRARDLVASLVTVPASPLRHCGVCFDSVDQLVQLWALTPHQRQAVSPASVEDDRDFADLLVATLRMGVAINRYQARRGGPPQPPVVH